MGKYGKNVFFVFCFFVVVFSRDFMAFGNVNEKDEHLSLKGVSFSYIIYSKIFYSFLASGVDKHAYDLHVFRNS